MCPGRGTSSPGFTDTSVVSAAPSRSASVWQPTASLKVLQARAKMLAAIRAFFAARGVLEVETPMLSAAAATDPALASMRVDPGGYWLHTSPELPMKRLLAAGVGPIYQVCRVFRDGERGRLHHPEFTLLEWYRPGWSLIDLMHEVADLVRALLGWTAHPTEFVPYRELFLRGLGVDPWHCTADDLKATAVARGLDATLDLDVDGWLDCLLTHCLEADLGRSACTFVHGYPPTQAALARLTRTRPVRAERFELYMQGMELANGFNELTDADEQSRRFASDLATRRRRGQPAVAEDRRFLEALRAGLPDCAGVALGLDRLLMLICQQDAIDKVLAFPIERA